MEYLVRKVEDYCKNESPCFLKAKISGEPLDPEIRVNPCELIHFGSDLMSRSDIMDSTESRAQRRMFMAGADYLLIPSEWQSIEAGQSAKLVGVATAYIKK